MRVRQQLHRPELFQQLTISAQSVHIRLALTPESAESDNWIARSFIADVFPQVWLDNSDNLLFEDSSTQYRPPEFLHEYPGQALFLARFAPTQQVIDWLAHPGACELTWFDDRLGQGSRVKHFSMPELHDEVFGARVFSGKPDGFAMLPWPHNVYKCNLKNTNTYHDGDYQTLYAMRQPHFDNLREARAKLIHGYVNGLQSYQDTDTIAIRFIDADGWIHAAQFSNTRVDVTVRGLRIFPGRVILKGDGVTDERQVIGPQAITFDLHGAPPPNLNVILANDREELDRAWRTRWPSPFDPPASHVLDSMEIDGVSPLALPPITNPAEDRRSPVRQSTGMGISGKDGKAQPQRRLRAAKETQDAMRPPVNVRVLRVVVASPGDVKKERESVPHVLEELNRGLARQLG